MLDTDEHAGLAVMAFDHGDRGAHVLLEPIDIGTVLKPQGRIGMAQAVDAALVAVGVPLKPCGFDEGFEAGPIRNGLAILMTEDVVLGIGAVAPFALPIEVPLGTGLADHEPLPGLALDPEGHPFPMLIGVAIHISPFKGTGLPLPHA